MAQQQCFADRLKWPDMGVPVWSRGYDISRWPPAITAIVDAEVAARLTDWNQFWVDHRRALGA